MAPDLIFGPPGDQWKYERSSKTYDLTRGFGSGVAVRTTRGPPDTVISISPGLTALVIVDMQNFFLHPRCRDHPTGLAAVAPTGRLIEKCRELGIQVPPLVPRTPGYSL
jgi:phosphatidylethanolamine-binding protein